MYCVLWTYTVPPSLSEEAIGRHVAAVAGRYLGAPGLGLASSPAAPLSR